MRLIIAAALLATVLFGGEAKVELLPKASKQALVISDSFDEANKRAKKEKRPLMLIVSKHTCRWCTHFRENALSDPEVIKLLNRDFVVYEGFVEKVDFPRELVTSGTPGTWFLDLEGKPMYQPLMGSVDAAGMAEALGVVKKKFDMLAAAPAAAKTK